VPRVSAESEVSFVYVQVIVSTQVRIGAFGVVLFQTGSNLQAVTLFVPRLGVFIIACYYIDGILLEPGMMSTLMA
jgi:hypothetical protein